MLPSRAIISITTPCLHVDVSWPEPCDFALAEWVKEVPYLRFAILTHTLQVARTTVPFPRMEEMAKDPPESSARSFMLASPRPFW